MEDKDVNPLIDNSKPFSRLLHDSQAKFVKFCNKYRSEIFFGTSIVLVSLCLGVILSILFQGGKLWDNPNATGLFMWVKPTSHFCNLFTWYLIFIPKWLGVQELNCLCVCVFLRWNVSCFEFKGSINVSCECHPFPPAAAGPVYRNITSLRLVTPTSLVSLSANQRAGIQIWTNQRSHTWRHVIRISSSNYQMDSESGFAWWSGHSS